MSTGSQPTRQAARIVASGVRPNELGPLPGHEQDGTGPVGDLRRRPGRVDAVWPGHRLERGQSLERGLPEALVANDAMGRAGRLAVVAQVGCVDRKNLTRKTVLGPCPRRPVLRQLAELVAVGPRDPPLVRDPLRALELRGEFVVLPVGLVDRLADRGSLGMLDPIGTLLITSTPQPTATSTTPEATSE